MASCDFGAAEFIQTKFMNQLLVYRSIENKCLTFQKKDMSHDGSGVRYECCKCRELNKVRTITVRDGRIIGRKSPEVDHHPNCVQIEPHLITVRSMTDEMLENVRVHRMTPREA
jgi:hypothetical protein